MLEEIRAAHDRARELAFGRCAEGPPVLPHVLRIVLARNKEHSDAVGLLLDNEHWAPAAMVVRSMLEDAALLGYLCARADDAEELADLFVLSTARDLERLEALGPNIGGKQPDAAVRAGRQGQCDELERRRDRLWRGARRGNGTPKYGNKHVWCGLRIAEVFDEAGLRKEHEFLYVLTSAAVHGSAYSTMVLSPGQLWGRSQGSEHPPVAVRSIKCIHWHALVLHVDATQRLLAEEFCDIPAMQRLVNGQLGLGGG